MTRRRRRDLFGPEIRPDGAGPGRGDAPTGDGGGQRERSAALAALAADGWVLPPGLTAPGRAAWTLVGTVDSRTATMVDPRGLVTPEPGEHGWSLDWWVGADDRWHLPAQESGVRQRLIGDAPVVETSMRIPGGDAVQRVYGMRGADFPGGDEYVVIEVENRSSVPFALAWAIRPLTPEGITVLDRIALEPVAGGTGRDPATTAVLGGRSGVVFPRRPARVAGSCGATGDVAAVVLAGAASAPGSDGGPEELASCRDRSASAAFIFPVPHTATVRCVIPLGVTAGGRTGYPAAIPPPDRVAAGWASHADRGVRTSLPDQKLDAVVRTARRTLPLAPWSTGLRHAGPPRPRPSGDGIGADALTDAARIVAALDRAGHPEQARRTLVEWTAGLDHLRAARPRPEGDAALIDAVATHLLLTGEHDLFEDLLPEVVAAVERVDRRGRRSDGGGRSDGLGSWEAARALRSLAAALRVAGQGAAAERVNAAGAVGAAARPPVTEAGPVAVVADLIAARGAVAAGDRAGIDALDRVVAGASATRALATGLEGQDLAATALLLDVVRDLLAGEVDGGLALLRLFPPRWYGGPVEVHGLPTRFGVLSYAVRWHDDRPALLWELELRSGAESPRITVPGLDAAWSTTGRRGDALLAPVAPPAGLDRVRLVAEHPDLDPAVRRPAETPPPAERRSSTPPPDGGTFS